MMVANSVAVLMPVFNSGKYLKESIDSILNQTYSTFDFIIINDGSTDNSEEIILSYNDKRIKYYKNDGNNGLIYSLNKGLEIIDADFLFRMDADDISMPSRIEKQLNFLVNNKNVLVCGTQVRYFGNGIAASISRYPLSHEAIKANLLFNNCLAHPSIAMRLREIKSNNFFYSRNFVHLEDYELWTRIMNYGQLANMSDVLLSYRIGRDNITAVNWKGRGERLKKVFAGILQSLEIEPSVENLKLHLELSGGADNIDNIRSLKKYSELLLFKNRSKQLFNSAELELIIKSNLKRVFYKIVDNNLLEVFVYWFSTKLISLSQIRYFVSSLLSKKN